MLRNIEIEQVRIGLNKSKAAEALGITTTTYSKYIKEEWPIPSDTLIKMARLFNCNVDYLLGLDESPAPARRAG